MLSDALVYTTPTFIYRYGGNGIGNCYFNGPLRLLME